MYRSTFLIQNGQTEDYTINMRRQLLLTNSGCVLTGVVFIQHLLFEHKPELLPLLLLVLHIEIAAEFADVARMHLAYES